MKKPALWICLFFFIQTAPALARGLKCIPQLADGSTIRTKIDLTNVSSRQSIANYKIRFFHANGSAWTLWTNLGQGSSFNISLPPRSVMRIETSGSSSPTSAGYALVEDLEPYNSVYAADYVLGITLYYEILTGDGVVDTISVPVGEATTLGTIPVEERRSQGIDTGIALVNLSSKTNTIAIDLYPTGSGSQTTATFDLGANEYRAEFLYQNLFPALQTGNFKGIAEVSSLYPIAFVALLQTPAVSGVQYATLVPIDREDLRRNSNLYVPLPRYGSTNATMPVDLDKFTVDYFRVGESDDYSWDLVYQRINTTTRRLVPIYGAKIAVFGARDESAFDAITLTQLKALTYSTDYLDLSDTSTALAQIPYAFAVITELGNYAKVRLIGTKKFTDGGNPYVDLIFEVTVYR